MWRFRRNRNPWERIAGDAGKLIDFIDSKAVDELVEQGKDNEAFSARVFAIRLAAALRDKALVDELTAKAEELLSAQTAAGMAVLQPNGRGNTDREDRRLKLDVRDQLGRCEISNAAAA